MPLILHFDQFGIVPLSAGLPKVVAFPLLPEALPFSATGPWGTVCLQEIAGSQFLLHHFFFSLTESLTIPLKEGKRNVHSLFSLRGVFEHTLSNEKPVVFQDQECVLFSSSAEDQKHRHSAIHHVFIKSSVKRVP